jgi:hypothetical protein
MLPQRDRPLATFRPLLILIFVTVIEVVLLTTFQITNSPYFYAATLAGAVVLLGCVIWVAMWYLRSSPFRD